VAPLEPGGVIGGRYQLEKTIGSGGMAKVWLAHDRLLDRQVAVKILADRYASDPDFVERFRREASAAAGLSHPNIVTVYDRGEAEGSYYIVMEHLPGPDLKAIIRQRGKLAPRQAVDAALQVLAALSAAHRRNVIHRDIKPQNVLVAEDGHLKVTDFGIARAGDDAGMTEIGSVIGTAQYLSPEQARGEDVTTASDCYSVGILLYELLTGRVPFDGDKPVAVAMRQINEVPVSPRVIVPQIPPQLSDIVMKALEKRPGSRYRTAEEFSDTLLAVRASLPEPAEDASEVLAAVESPATTRIIAQNTAATRVAARQPPMPAPAKKRTRGPLIAAIIALLVLGGGASAYFLGGVGKATQVVIPKVAGLTEADAITALEAQGLTVGTSERETSPTVKKDSVIRSDPEEGSKADKGAQITLVLSSGAERAAVPRLVGKTWEEARTELEDTLNFVAKREDVFSDDKPVGTVVKQDPVAGTTIFKGDTVTLSVSKGPDLVEVPKLSLETQAAAKALLEDAGLELGSVTTRETTKREPGLVLDQTPKAGTEARKGSSVDIVVSVAPEVKEVPMPDITGNTADAARAKLTNQGFRDPIAETSPSSEAAGTVIAQDPSPGTKVDPTKVTVVITVSSGPVQPPPDPGATTTEPPVVTP
jgi:eukaryotic-like serine/threonine-protein kinase